MMKSQGAYSQNPKENLRDLDDSAQTRKTKGARGNTNRSKGGRSKKGAGASVVEEESYYDEEEEEEYEDEEEED